MHNITELLNYKKSNIAVILGSGSSINDITEQEWEKLKTFDLWALNNWVYHPSVIPNFYHIEVKHYDAEIVKRRLEEKWDKYKDVIYLVPSIRQDVVDVIGHENEAKIFYYEYIKRNIYKNKINANYNIKIKGIFVRSYNTSLSLLIDMLYKLKYRYIILAGVDLLDSRYFWTNGDPNIYGEVHQQWNKEISGGKIDAPHKTHHISNFIIDFNNQHMKSKKREIFLITKKSKLYPDLNCIKIENI